MTGTVYVANFSWYFTPMWELAKRTLPPKALKIVMFPSAVELKEFVPEDVLPKGALSIAFSTHYRPWWSFRLRIRLQDE
jgi:hypothetical protein